MNNQSFTVTTGVAPQIVVTEASPVSSQTPNAVSVVRKIEPIPEIITNGTGGTPEPVKVTMEQTTNPVAESKVNAAATSEPSTSLESGEFTPALECNDCIVPVPEQSASQSVEVTTASTATEPEPDDFRTVDPGCCDTYGILCMDYYEKVWKALHSGYAIPFWLLLLALPVSAGIMSALYMYSCPASHSMPMLMFTIGISLMAVFSLRISIIIRRMSSTEPDDCRNMLHTLLLISTFLTVVFFVTESVAYWKMTPTSHSGPEYCDPQFLTFSFWWNCAMCVVIVPIFFFPA